MSDIEPEKRKMLLESCWSKPVWNITHSGNELKVFIPRKNTTFTSKIGEDVEWRLVDGSQQKVSKLIGS